MSLAMTKMVATLPTRDKMDMAAKTMARISACRGKGSISLPTCAQGRKEEGKVFRKGSVNQLSWQSSNLIDQCHILLQSLTKKEELHCSKRHDDLHSLCFNEALPSYANPLVIIISGDK